MTVMLIAMDQHKVVTLGIADRGVSATVAVSAFDRSAVLRELKLSARTRRCLG